MTAPSVLFGHDRRSVARPVQRVLEIAGFSFVHATGGEQARALLKQRRFSALVVDVALPEIPGYELCSDARTDAPGQGADVVVLVASVYRRTSYKRRPSRLYGADDYVEIHHLCDSLPDKLFTHLGMKVPQPSLDAQQAAREALRVEGDARMTETDDHTLAGLIVADMVLYNGDAIFTAKSLTEAAAAVAADLEIARELYAQVERAEGRAEPTADPVGDAFAQLMVTMGRAAPHERLPGARS
ncbi:MAG: response regulator [Myxococcota bacterium]